MAKIKVRKIPMVVEVEQFFYDRPQIDGVFYPLLSDDGKTYVGDAYVVTAHEQKVYLKNGDWIFPETDGVHFYSVKDEVLRKTYQVVEE